MISLWDTAPEELVDRGTKYTNRAIQAIQDPTGRENAKNIYFGLIMGVSAALPTFLHLGIFYLLEPTVLQVREKRKTRQRIMLLVKKGIHRTDNSLPNLKGNPVFPGSTKKQICKCVHCMINRVGIATTHE